jgi:drug/metabolite transporter (DMT)-like permease
MNSAPDARARRTPITVLMAVAKNPLPQIVLNALVVTAAELFLKMGARATAQMSAGPSWTGITGLASIWTWVGMVLLILSLVSWLYILRNVPLSVAFPLSHVVHVFIPLASWFFLHEIISTTRWLGIALLIIGLLIVAKPFARIEEKLL